MRKSIIGYQYPFYVFLLMGGLYYMVLVNLVYEYDYLFMASASLVVTIVYIVIVNFFLLLVLLSFFVLLGLNPGEPPQFWVF